MAFSVILAFGTFIEHCLPFIGRTQLHCVEFKAAVATFWACFIDLRPLQIQASAK